MYVVGMLKVLRLSGGCELLRYRKNGDEYKISANNTSHWATAIFSKYSALFKANCICSASNSIDSYFSLMSKHITYYYIK